MAFIQKVKFKKEEIKAVLLDSDNNELMSYTINSQKNYDYLMLVLIIILSVAFACSFFKNESSSEYQKYYELKKYEYAH